ncbi:hypothetical protein DH2020_033956 [Rehmannia glutinosa]|uniref:Uncharacterized protein n=1 Tax=Rehmannia glutinosa TaxID=99300 RepID=A0ABR0VAV2_REHGL
MSMASSIIVGHKYSTANFHLKPYPRSQALYWSPISRLSFPNCTEKMGSWGNKTILQTNKRYRFRKSFVVYANGEAGAPLPSGPPSSNPMSWILGLFVSFVLPFFSNKWGPLWVVKNRIENAVQTVEDIAEAVEKVAAEVDKIAEDMADDLPQGKLKNLVELVENVAEKTAKTADSLDNVIDKVQEAQDEVEDIVESLAKQAKNPPKEAQDQ